MPANWIKDYFSFTLKERIAITALLFLIALIFFLPDLIPSQKWKPSARELASFDSIARSLKKTSTDTSETESNSFVELNEPMIEERPMKRRLFAFDPNTATISEWRALGIKDKTIRTIQRYLSKGGQFRKPADLGKIYGLYPEDYKVLEPYIRIGAAVRNSSNASKEEASNEFSGNRTHSEWKGTRRGIPIIELNSTDTTALIMLPGIGSKLASRIINFRDRLGGFYSIDQVAETYGLPDSTFQIIKPHLILGARPVLKININLAEVSLLKEHPYISWTAARALVEYRRQHGPFQRVEDISRVPAFLPDQLRKLFPYLSID